MKASPRYRETTAYIKLRHQPAQIKYPLLALHVAANPQAYDAEPLNVRPDVSTAQLLNEARQISCTKLLCLLLLKRVICPESLNVVRRSVLI